MDPVWQVAENKILFLNSYKMKLSVMLGVAQMLFGVLLSFTNHRYFKRPINIVCEFIPQVIFLMAIFGYMNILIVYKWMAYDSTTSGCAPSVLITLINMFLMKDAKKECDWMYSGQKFMQTILVLVALVCVPWMLVLKPFMIKKQRDAKKWKAELEKRAAAAGGDVVEVENGDLGPEPIPIGGIEIEDHDEEMGDVVIHQAIHTIEYCLGSISHTASYLRLWALSLAHGQLSEVLWSMVLRVGLTGSGIGGGIVMYFVFAMWASLTIAVLLLMEGLSAFLHALRLHWVEFQSKFYSGSGYSFQPFSFEVILAQAEVEDVA